jgi:hypothetical protein
VNCPPVGSKSAGVGRDYRKVDEVDRREGVEELDAHQKRPLEEKLLRVLMPFQLTVALIATNRWQIFFLCQPCVLESWGAGLQGCCAALERAVKVIANESSLPYRQQRRGEFDLVVHVWRRSDLAAGKLNRKQADRFAADMKAIIEKIRSSGVTLLCVIAKELAAGNVVTARGRQAAARDPPVSVVLSAQGEGMMAQKQHLDFL